MNPLEYIDKYMSGKMSEEERLSFEEAMAQDGEIQSLVKNYDAVKKVSSGILEAELLKDVERAVQSTKEDTAIDLAKSNRNRLLIAIAIFALLAAIFFFIKKQPYSPEEAMQLMADHQISPDNLTTLRSTDISMLSKLDQAKDLYARNIYAESINLLQGIIRDSNEEEIIQDAENWLAHALLRNHKYDAAEQLFIKSNRPEDKCHSYLCKALKKEITKSDLAQLCSTQ